MIHLSPAGITQYWNAVAVAVRGGAVGTLDNDVALTNVMGAMAGGVIQCWVLLEPGDPLVFLGAVTSFISTDPWTKRRKLFGYTVYTVPDVSLTPRAWGQWLKAWEDYGRKNGCVEMAGVTDVPHWCREAVRMYGFKARMMLEKEIV